MRSGIGILLALAISGAAAAQTDTQGHPGIRASRNADALIRSLAPQTTICPSGTVLQGVDVSHWQGTINWNAMYAAGIRFMYTKAGEGLTYVDPTFATNTTGARAAGIAAGAYWFFHANVDPTQEAEKFLATLSGVLASGDLVPCIDFEVSDGVTQPTISSNLATFSNVVYASLGVRPVIYTSPSFWNSYGSTALSANPLWIANWGVTCPSVPTSTWATWQVWQYTDSGSVGGVSPIDRDESNGPLVRYCGDAAAPLVTPPAGIALDQTTCCGVFGGATAATSSVLATFLAAGSATDDCTASPARLAPQIGGLDVTSATCFPAGATSVAFRFQDANGRIGTASSAITVRMFGDLNLDAVVDPSDMVVLRAFFNFAASPGTPPFTAPLQVADVTHDAAVDPSDMVLLRAYLNLAVSCLAP